MRIVHFELPADSPARWMAFYRRAFGWRFEKWDGPMDYWMIKTGEGPGIAGRRRAAGCRSAGRIVFAGSGTTR